MVLCVLSAAGCLQAGEAPDPASTVLVFKHGRLSGDGQVLSSLLREFEQRYPGVTVREEVLPASSDLARHGPAGRAEGGTW